MATITTTTTILGVDPDPTPNPMAKDRPASFGSKGKAGSVGRGGFARGEGVRV